MIRNQVCIVSCNTRATKKSKQSPECIYTSDSEWILSYILKKNTNEQEHSTKAFRCCRLHRSVEKTREQPRSC